MKKRMRDMMREEGLKQTGKFTRLPGTGGVRPKPEIPDFTGKTYYVVWVCFMSKNALSNKNQAIITLVFRAVQPVQAT